MPLEIEQDLVPCVSHTVVVDVRCNRVNLRIEAAVKEYPRRRHGVMRRGVLSTEDRGEKEHELRAKIERVNMHVVREVVQPITLLF